MTCTHSDVKYLCVSWSVQEPKVFLLSFTILGARNGLDDTRRVGEVDMSAKLIIGFMVPFVVEFSDIVGAVLHTGMELFHKCFDIFLFLFFISGV